jgi:hypothetical protein
MGQPTLAPLSFSGLGFAAVKDGDDALTSSFNYYFLDYSFGHSP